MKNYISLWILVFGMINIHSQNLTPHPMPCISVVPAFSPPGQSFVYYPDGIRYSTSCIVDGNNEAQVIEIATTGYTEYKAGDEIYFDGEVFINPSSNVNDKGQDGFLGLIEKSGIQTVWFEPNNTPGFVPKYHKLELGFKLDETVEQDVNDFMNPFVTGGINPFDPEEINFKVKLTSPSGEIIETGGFYYQPFTKNLADDEWEKESTPYNWRLRFAPDEEGEWSGEVEVTSLENTTLTSNFIFTCVPSDHKGVLKISDTESNADRYMYLSETNETFVPIGHNITTRGPEVGPVKNDLHKKWINELSSVGGNFFRMEMPLQGALPDWPIHDNYTGKLDEMYGFDEIVDLADLKEMYFIMFRHHVEVQNHETEVDKWDSWDKNPYKTEFNLNSSLGYFTDGDIRKWQKNCLKYIFNRWGYSPSFSFYGYSEVNNWISEMGGAEDFDYGVFYVWYKGLQDYIKNDLHFLGDKFVCSFTSNKSVSDLEKSDPTGLFFESSDIIALHAYNEEKSKNYKKRYNYVDHFLNHWGTNKPVILEETGLHYPDIYCCTGIDFHNTIWSSLLNGSMGVGMHWWWDRGIHDNEYLTDYIHISSFLENEDLRNGLYSPQKWKNDNWSDMRNATIENFALKSENKERVLGWVHNATFYWRNMYNYQPCIQELIQNIGILSSPCMMDDGTTLGETVVFLNDPNWYDSYTDASGAQPISSGFGAQENPTFNVTGLKTNLAQLINPWAKKHWYQVSYFSTHAGNAGTPPINTQVVSTNILQQLKPNVPNLTSINPDYSYKVEYLGKFNDEPAPRMASSNGNNFPEVENVLINTSNDVEEATNEEEQDESTKENQDELNKVEISLMPNPSNGIFEIRSNEEILSIIMYDIKGNIVIKQDEINNFSANINISSLSNSIYMLQVSTENEIISKTVVKE